jgi:hypothetical protein
MNVGTKLQEGVAVAVTDQGVLVGRVAGENELATPFGHSLHVLNGERVFLSADQAPIAAAALHPLRASARRTTKRGRK